MGDIGPSNARVRSGDVAPFQGWIRFLRGWSTRPYDPRYVMSRFQRSIRIRVVKTFQALRPSLRSVALTALLILDCVSRLKR
jgi:hypothetical protein